MRFALVSDEDDTVWATCAEVSGVFTGTPAAGGSRSVELLGCAARGPLAGYCEGRLGAKKVGGNVELRVLDAGGKAIGAYALTVERALRCDPSAMGAGLFDLTVAVLYFDAPDPLAESIWELWRGGVPREKNAWAEYTSEGRSAWLDVVRRHRSWDERRGADAPPGAVFELDGRHVTDEQGFYCAIGEAVNGPGGYFGTHPYALVDCLRGGFGATVPFTLVWRDSAVARTRLDRTNDSESGFDDIVGILRHAGVDLVLA